MDLKKSLKIDLDKGGNRMGYFTMGGAVALAVTLCYMEYRSFVYTNDDLTSNVNEIEEMETFVEIQMTVPPPPPPPPPPGVVTVTVGPAITTTTTGAVGKLSPIAFTAMIRNM